MMPYHKGRADWCFAATLITVNLAVITARPQPTFAKVDIEGKVVVANIDRHKASIRIGSVRKDIAPKKASVLSPKRFPLTLEIWTGTRGRAMWQKQTVAAAGVYTVRFQNGTWTLAKHQPRSRSASRTIPRRSTRRTLRPTYRRATGARPRVVRRSGRRPYYGRRIPLLGRVAGDVLALYGFVRDEEDRDLIRKIIVGGEIDDAITEEIIDKLDDLAVNLPAQDRREFERALNGLKGLDANDFRELEAATDDEWGQARDALGDQVTDRAWQEVESDLKNVDIGDLADQGDVTLEDAGVESFDADVDIADLADGGELASTLDNVDVGVLGGNIDDVDIGDLGADFGTDIGSADFGSRPAFGGGGLDGGGFEGGRFEGGNFGGGGYDAGGFDYDTGGFGGGFDGGGFDGGGFDGGGFDGGGFDGGGFDGGGFDDFGGGFDDF